MQKRVSIFSVAGGCLFGLLLTTSVHAEDSAIAQGLRACLQSGELTSVKLLDAEGKSPEQKSMIFCEGGSASGAGKLSSALQGMTKEATELDDEGKERVIQYFGHPQGFESQCVRYPTTFSCMFAVDIKSSMPAKSYFASLKRGRLPLTALPLNSVIRDKVEP